MAIDVSVVFLQYNPIYEKVIASLYSLIMQQDVDFEIIVSDDGSNEDYFDNIEGFFKKYNFKNFQLKKNKNNLGIVKNYLSAVEITKGKYIFGNSPGDIMVNEYALRDYVRFANKHKASCLFARAIYYEKTESQSFVVRSVIPNPPKPRAYSWYFPQSFGKFAFYNGGFILGSVFLRKKEYALKYFSDISKTAKYVEDNTSAFLSLMSNEKIIFYDKVILWYETGGTRPKDVQRWWDSACERDFEQTWAKVKKQYVGDSLFDFHDDSKSKVMRFTKHPILFFYHILFNKIMKTASKTDASKKEEKAINQYYNNITMLITNSEITL